MNDDEDPAEIGDDGHYLKPFLSKATAVRCHATETFSSVRSLVGASSNRQVAIQICALCGELHYLGILVGCGESSCKQSAMTIGVFWVGTLRFLVQVSGQCSL